MNKDLKAKEDASPLTTSTESESFDTWTVITDKPKEFTPEEIPSPPPTPEKSEEEDDEVVDDGVGVEVIKASVEKLENRYTDMDDLSDGISIISECESVGRISPHPELRKHLSELNMRFVDVIQPSLRMTNSGGDNTSRYYGGSSEHSSDVFNQVEPLMENNRRPRRTSHHVVSTPDLQPTLRPGLRRLFYVGAFLGVLAIISKFKYESTIITNADVLNQKIDDLELKNNLMRAEIDILSKQVNYLTSLSENQKYSSSSKPRSNPSKEKKMKVWPGNGNIIEEVVINPKDLKTPYKCEGPNNLDIAGMCVELPNTAESVLDSLGEKVRSVIEENDHFTNFEKVVDKVVKLTENPFSENDYNPTDSQGKERLKPKDFEPEESGYTPHEHKPEKYDSKKYQNDQKPDKYDNKKYDKDQKPEKYERKKYEHDQKSDKHDYDSKKYENKREHLKKHKNDDDSGESKERYRRDRSNEDFNGSGERSKKSKDHKKYDKYSSSEYESAKRDADGQWHEKLMQHRENSRKNNDKHRHDKNWYIERGDSREQARVTEQKYR